MKSQMKKKTRKIKGEKGDKWEKGEKAEEEEKERKCSIEGLLTTKGANVDEILWHV